MKAPNLFPQSSKFDQRCMNDKPFIFLIPEGSGIYKCQGYGLYGFGTTMRDAYTRWCAKRAKVL